MVLVLGMELKAPYVYANLTVNTYKLPIWRFGYKSFFSVWETKNTQNTSYLTKTRFNEINKKEQKNTRSARVPKPGTELIWKRHKNV